MTGDSRLTVAVLSRNRPEYLERMLSSLRLGAPDADVFVRDQSDDDRCERLVARVAAQNPEWRISHLYAEPRGQLQNVLGAIAACQTEFLIIVHDDDLVSPRLAQVLLPPLLADRTIGFAAGNVNSVDRTEKLLKKMTVAMYSTTGVITFANRDERARFHVVERKLTPFLGTIFRTEALVGVRLPPEASTLPDLWVARHMVEQEFNGWATSEVMASYRVHNASVSADGRDLDGYRFSVDEFLRDPTFKKFHNELQAALVSYERSAFVAKFVGGDRSKQNRDRILASSSSISPGKRMVMRVALRPPLSALTCKYLRFHNPRLRT